MNNFKFCSAYLFNRRLFVVLLLGFSSGLPLALTSSTLQAWYTVSGVNIIAIGMLGLVGQPYIYKFIWAPLMDRYEIPWLGRRRGWILIAQVLLVFSICGMSWMQPDQHPFLLGTLGVWVAFLSASQDITIDAYRTDLLEPEERGMGAAFAVTGYRMAMLVSGGAALLMAQEVGWHNTYLLMGFLMLAGVLATLIAPAPRYGAEAPDSILKAIMLPWQDLVQRQSGMLILLFIFLYKIGYEFILAMTPTFLLRGLGFSLAQVGVINKGVGFIALFIGVFVGGITLIRMDVVRGLLWFGLLQALSILGYVYLSVVGKNMHVLMTVIFLENLFVGMESAAFVAFLMGLCNHRYTAMQFVLLSALATAGRIFAGPVGALIVDYSNWTSLYLFSFFMAIPPLLLLWHGQYSFRVKPQLPRDLS